MPDSIQPPKPVKNITLNKGQNAALKMAVELASTSSPTPTIGVISGVAGCHRANQEILMSDGKIKLVQDVAVGDRLMGADSIPRNVLNLIRGTGKMVRITPVKGESWVVNEDHILTVRQVCPYPKKTVDVSVKEFLVWPRSQRRSSKLLRTRVEFETNHVLPLDPYFMGAYLGDGQAPNGGSVGISKPNQEIKELAEAEAAKLGLRVSQAGFGSTVTWRIVGDGGENPLMSKLSQLGLKGKDSGGKFIPEVYKTACREERLYLLAGLMDTDGHFACGGFDYISKSRALADGVAFVARSLGFAAYVVETQKGCQNGFVGTYYRLTVSGDCSLIPTRIKKATPRRQIKNVLHTGFTVTELDEEEPYFGFTIDGDGRYVLGDFTITHNSGKTTTLKAICEAVGGITVVTPTGKAAARVTEATGLPASTLHRFLYKPQEDRNGDMTWLLKNATDLVRPTSGLIVIDEASMVGEALWEDVYEVATMLRCNLLPVGDPFQLPPVETDPDAEPFSLLSLEFKAHRRVDLIEIMRQAAENPIIRASMALRRGDWVSALLDINQIPQDRMLEEAHRIVSSGGAVICQRNVTRHYINNAIRKMRGYGDDLIIGEPLLVKRNSYEINRFNGETVVFEGWETSPTEHTSIYDQKNRKVHFAHIGKAKVDGQTAGIAVEEVRGQMEGCPPSSIAKATHQKYGKKFPHLNANFGYCLTSHSSQGSQWPEILYILEKGVNLEHVEGRRAAYTSLTRTEDKVSVVYKPKFDF